MSVTIHRATPADAETLLRIQIAAFHHDTVLYPEVPLGGPPGYDSLDSMLAKIRDDNTYTILHHGECVGGIVVYHQGDGHYHLDVLFIDPQHHNQGIGTQAMHLLEHTHPATRWTLDTPLYAVRNQHFYEKFGYVRVGVIEEEDITLIAYEKRL